MAFHLIGLGLEIDTVSVEALAVIQRCKEVYLEGYTVEFPYDTTRLDDYFGTAVQLLDREDVESEEIIKKAAHHDIALLVYGDSLSATTHTQLILACHKAGIPYKVHHNASILTAIAHTGLQLYKFGKTASMPMWDKDKNYTPTSFMRYHKENEAIGAHTLIVIDIGLPLDRALYQLEAACNAEGFELQKPLIILSHAGLSDQKIYYDTIDTLKAYAQVQNPFVIIIPADLHFLEAEALDVFREKSYG